MLLECDEEMRLEQLCALVDIFDPSILEFLDANPQPTIVGQDSLQWTNLTNSFVPGDSLQIFVWDHADLSTVVQVRPDGKISTPLVEDLQAAGRTPTQLARDIEGVLSEYVRTPVVTVIMQGFVGEQAQQVRVVGQAVEPQSLQFRQGMTVLDVMIQVGGLSEFAAGNRAKIVRKSGGEQIEIIVRLNDLINKGKVEENVSMRPGDVLIIPESFF